MTLVTLFLPYLCALQLQQCNKFGNRLSISNRYLILLFLFFMLFMIMKAEINKSIYILFIHRYYIIPEFFMYLAFIILEILEFIKLHSCKFGLV